MHANRIESGKWYIDKEVAITYGIGRSTLWSWVSKGRFPQPVKIGARTTRWHGSDLLAWESSLRESQSVGNGGGS